MSASATSATIITDGTRVQVTEKTGIHWSTLYLHTIPGALKAVCLVCDSFGVNYSTNFCLMCAPSIRTIEKNV